MMHWLTIFLMALGSTLAIAEHNAVWCVAPYILALLNQIVASSVRTAIESEDVPYE